MSKQAKKYRHPLNTASLQEAFKRGLAMQKPHDPHWAKDAQEIKERMSRK